MESKQMDEQDHFTQWLVMHCSVANHPKTEWLKTTIGFCSLGRGWWGRLTFVPHGISWLTALPGKLLLVIGSAGAAGQVLSLLHMGSPPSSVRPLRSGGRSWGGSIPR